MELQRIALHLPTPKKHRSYFAPFEIQGLAKKHVHPREKSVNLTDLYDFLIVKSAISVKKALFNVAANRKDDIPEDEWWKNQVNLCQIKLPDPTDGNFYSCHEAFEHITTNVNMQSKLQFKQLFEEMKIRKVIPPKENLRSNSTRYG